MKREILFKGKSVNTGEWVESMTVAKGTIKRKRDNVFMEIGDNKWVGIEPKSLSQFINQKDKKRQKMFLKVTMIMMVIVSFGVITAMDLSLLNWM